MPPPTAFISYSHDSEEHKVWVRTLAQDLRRDGIDVTLDLWHLALGAELPRFMEETIARCDYALLICTPNYIVKANQRGGGVGYETSLFTSQLLTPAQIAAKPRDAIIPIVRQLDSPRRLPAFVGSRYYVDLSADLDPTYHKKEYEKLVRFLHATPEYVAPPVGSNPYARTSTVLKRPALMDVPPDPREQPPDFYRTLEEMRTAGAKALVARERHFPHLVGATEALRNAELLKILTTHRDYLRTSVLTATSPGAISPDRWAEEIEHLVQPPGWSRAGVRGIVDLPWALGWALHRLLGAMLVWRSRSSEAVRLALESIQDVEEEQRPIVMRRALTGWPIRGIESSQSWQFLRALSKEWAWICELFGNEECYWIACVAHSLGLNLAEFLFRVQHGPPFETIIRDSYYAPRVPPYYMDESSEIQRRAVRLLTRDRDGLRAIIESCAKGSSILEQWQQWIAFQEGWRTIESVGFVGGAPHRDLLQRILDGGRQ